MVKIGRNAPCPCGSGKKYKKCCLHDGSDFQSTAPCRSYKSSNLKIIKTLTDEFFQPVRLYYVLHNKESLVTHFQQLKCMDYDEEFDAWVLSYNNEAANLGLAVPAKKVPQEAQPLIIATIYIKHNDSVLIDVRSIERAIKLIQFINAHVPRDVAEVTHAGIYNGLIGLGQTSVKKLKEADIDYDELFDETVIANSSEEKLQDHKALVAQYGKEEAARIFFQHVEDSAKKPLPKVEKLPLHYYEDGIEKAEMMFTLRQVVALEHFRGNTDFSFYDAVAEVAAERRIRGNASLH